MDKSYGTILYTYSSPFVHLQHATYSGGTHRQQRTCLFRQYRYAITRTKFQPQLCPYASNTTHLSTSQHIQTNRAANFTTTRIIYIWDSVKIYIHFFLVGPTSIRVMTTKATLCHVSQPSVSQSQYHRKFTSDPSQVANLTMFVHHITHFQLVLKSRMSGAIPLLPLHSKMAWI
jgi:hypothetical protein